MEDKQITSQGSVLERILVKQSFMQAFVSGVVHALPFAGSSIASTGANLVVSILYGRYSDDANAAMMEIVNTQHLFVALLFSAVSAINVRGSDLYNLSDLEGLKRYFKAGLLISLILFLVSAGFLAATKPILIDIFRQPTGPSTTAANYFFYYLMALPGYVLSMNFQQLLVATQHRIAMMIISGIGSILLASSATLLINGFLGLPKLGERGLAISYAIQFWFNSITYFIFLFKHGFFKSSGDPEAMLSLERRPLLQQGMSEDENSSDSPEEYAQLDFSSSLWVAIKDYVKFGFPIMGGMGAEFLQLYIIGIFAGWLGSVSQAEMNIVNQTIFFIFPVLIALRQSIMSQMSVSLSEIKKINKRKNADQGNENDEVKLGVARHNFKRTLVTSVVLPLIYAAIVSIPIVFAAEPISGIFIGSDNPDKEKITKEMYRIIFPVLAASFASEALRTGLSSITIGIGRSSINMFSAWIGLIIFGVPLAYLLGPGIGGAVAGLRGGEAIGILVASVSIIAGLYYKKRHDPEVASLLFFGKQSETIALNDLSASNIEGGYSIQ